MTRMRVVLRRQRALARDVWALTKALADQARLLVALVRERHRERRDP